MIWKAPIILEELNQMPANIVSHLGIQFIGWTDNFLVANMPVNERTHQPFGILHGGASVVLAETLGSMASLLLVDRSKHLPVGLEVNANHLRPVKSGVVTGACTPLHIGGKTHVWDIRIVNEAEKLVCISRLTVVIIAAI